MKEVADRALRTIREAEPGDALATDLGALLKEFSDVRVESLPMTLECESVAEYCQIFADLAWKSRIASLSDADAARFRDAISEVAKPYVDRGRFRLVATSLCASGRK